MKRAQDLLEGGNAGAISYNEWLRRKDAERRMKKRLIDEAKTEIR
jgi:hypothetical protein